MKPLGKRLVVREEAPPEKIGLIIVPAMVKPQMAMLPHVCVIVAISDGVSEEYKELKPGDRIVIHRLAPIAILEHEKLLVITEDLVLAKLED